MALKTSNLGTQNWGIRRGVALAAVVSLALPIVEFAEMGRSAAERLATEMAMPLGLLWCVLTLIVGGTLGGVIWGVPDLRQKSSKLLPLVIVLWLFVTFFGNRYVAWLALTTTEHPVVQISGREKFAAVIMLGGGMTVDPNDDPQFAQDGDRIRPLLQLWNAGQTQRLIVTGSSVVSDRPAPAEIAESLLRSMGVPGTAITRIEGVNTDAEMRGLKDFFAGDTPEFAGELPIGLSTSAFHMPRALRLAKRYGLDFKPIPTAFRASSEPMGIAAAIVPNASSLDNLSRCWREWLAGLVGR